MKNNETNTNTSIAANAVKKAKTAKLTSVKVKKAIQEAKVYATFKTIGTKLRKGFKCFINNLGRLMTLSIIIALLLRVTAHFYPELPSEISAIYGFYNGILRLGEFALKTAFGFFASLFNGNFFDFQDSMLLEFKEMWNAFWSWCSSLTF